MDIIIKNKYRIRLRLKNKFKFYYLNLLLSNIIMLKFCTTLVPLLLLPSTCTALCASCTAPGPAVPAAQPAWFQALRAERDAVLRKINFTGGVFDTDALAWTQTAYIQPQMVCSWISRTVQLFFSLPLPPSSFCMYLSVHLPACMTCPRACLSACLPVCLHLWACSTYTSTVHA